MKGVAVIVAGAISGFLGAWGAMLLSAPKPTKSESVAATASPPEHPQPERLVSILRPTPEPASSAACAASSSDAPSAPVVIPRTPEERAARLKDDQAIQRDAQRSAIVAHDQEPRNPNWATMAETSIRDAFTKLPTVKHASLDKVDCRWESCVMNVSWKELTDARAEMADVAGDLGPLSEYCSRTLVLDEPTGGAQRASVVFQCGQQVAQHQNR